LIPTCKSCELEQAVEKWQQNQNKFGHDKIVLSLQDRAHSQELETRIMLEYMLMSWKDLRSIVINFLQ